MNLDVNFLSNLLSQLLKKTFDKRTKGFFEQSQLIYERRKELIHWVKLNDFLEYHIRLENKFSSRSIYQTHSHPCSTIRIKNISDKILSRIEIQVKTESHFENSRREQRIIFEDLNPQEERVESLDKIPLQEIRRNELDNNIYVPCSHGDLFIKTLLIEYDGVKLKNFDKTYCFKPIFSHLLNDVWVEKDGYYWNLNWLEKNKQIMLNRLESLGYYNDDVISKLLLKIIAIPQAFNAIFWSLLLTKLYNLDEEEI